jgi:hypothetical protein
VAASASAAPLGRGRKIAVWTLVVVATLLTLVSILTMWVRRQVLDNTAWKNATTQIVQDPQVQGAIATYTVNQLYGPKINLPQRFEDRLPDNLKALGVPFATALEQPLTQGVKRLLERPRLQQLFIQASAIAHEKLVNILEDKTNHGLSTANGVVTLDLHELLVEVGTQLGVPADALARAPDAGTITLMKSDQLGAVQNGVQAIRVLSVWLLVAVFFLYGLAIYLARGARRATLRNEGFGLVLVGILVLLIRELLGNYVIDALATPGYEPATHRLWLIGTAILGQIGAATILYGAIAALGAVFAGPTRIAVRLRRGLAPTLNEHQGIVWGTVGFVYLLAILWGGTHALRTWWGVLLLGALIAIGVAALRRQTLSEFPSGAVPAVAGVPLPAAVAAYAGATRPEPAAEGSPADELARLNELHDAGGITDAEFEQAKKKLAHE